MKNKPQLARPKVIQKGLQLRSPSSVLDHHFSLYTPKGIVSCGICKTTQECNVPAICSKVESKQAWGLLCSLALPLSLSLSLCVCFSAYVCVGMCVCLGGSHALFAVALFLLAHRFRLR